MRLKWCSVIAVVGLLCACTARTPAPIHDRSPVMKGAEPGTITYMVRTGDTIFAIAQLHGLTVDDVASANGIGAPYLIKPGQVLRIRMRDTADRSPPVAAIERSARTASNRDARPIQRPSATTQSRWPEPPPRTRPKESGVKLWSESTQFNPGWQWPVSSNPLRDFTPSRKGIDYILDEGEDIVAASDGEVVYAGAGTLKYKHLIIIRSPDSSMVAYEFNADLTISQNTMVKKGDVLATVNSGRAVDEPLRRFHFGIWRDGKPRNPRTVIEK